MIERMITEIEPQLELVLRIIIACVLGILIGLERKNRKMCIRDRVCAVQMNH